MLNIGINLFFLFSILGCSFLNYKISIFLYVVGLFVSPVLHYGTLYLSFDVWCFPILCLIILIKYKRNLRLKVDRYSLLPYFLAFLAISAFHMIVYQTEISLPTTYAILRFVFTIAIIKKAWQYEWTFWLDKVLTAVLVLNLACCVVQLTNLVSVETFYGLYYKSSMTPLATELTAGKFARAYGTTGTPVYLGAIAALSYAFYMPVCLENEKKIRFGTCKLFIAAVCGVLALSKTAILSIPLITLFSLLLYVVNGKKRSAKNLMRFLLVVVCALLILAGAVMWLSKEGFYIQYYLEFLKDPLKAFETRYDSESGILSGAMEVIKDNLLFGVGNKSFPDVFVGDSVYVVLLYETGIVGFFFYLLPYLIAFVCSIREKKISQSAILFAFALIATGGAFHLSYFWILFSAFVFGTCSRTKDVKYCKERALQYLIL